MVKIKCLATPQNYGGQGVPHQKCSKRLEAKQILLENALLAPPPNHLRLHRSIAPVSTRAAKRMSPASRHYRTFASVSKQLLVRIYILFAAQVSGK